MATVLTTPTLIGNDSYLIQNLGPDPLFVGGAGVTSSTGVQVNDGESISVGVTNSSVYVVSGGTSDMRLLIRGEGIFSATPAAV